MNRFQISSTIISQSISDEVIEMIEIYNVFKFCFEHFSLFGRLSVCFATTPGETTVERASNQTKHKYYEVSTVILVVARRCIGR